MTFLSCYSFMHGNSWVYLTKCTFHSLLQLSQCYRRVWHLAVARMEFNSFQLPNRKPNTLSIQPGLVIAFTFFTNPVFLPFDLDLCRLTTLSHCYQENLIMANMHELFASLVSVAANSCHYDTSWALLSCSGLRAYCLGMLSQFFNVRVSICQLCLQWWVIVELQYGYFLVVISSRIRMNSSSAHPCCDAHWLSIRSNILCFEIFPYANGYFPVTFLSNALFLKLDISVLTANQPQPFNMHLLRA